MPKNASGAVKSGSAESGVVAAVDRADLADLLVADDGVVGRAAERALARHQEAYADEVRRLLDAGLEVMRQQGPTRSPRVADIIVRAGLSRDAFYRHFASKDDLVDAIVRSGTKRLARHAEHQMGKCAAPEGQVVAWIAAVMAQATHPEVARVTRAVVWNGGHAPDRAGPDAFDSTALLAELLIEPLRQMGSPDPRRDAQAIGHAVIGEMRSAVQHCVTPTAADVEHLTRFCLLGIGTVPKARRPTAGGRRDQ